jgi:hypothetical protein
MFWQNAASGCSSAQNALESAAEFERLSVMIRHAESSGRLREPAVSGFQTRRSGILRGLNFGREAERLYYFFRSRNSFADWFCRLTISPQTVPTRH